MFEEQVVGKKGEMSQERREGKTGRGSRGDLPDARQYVEEKLFSFFPSRPAQLMLSAPLARMLARKLMLAMMSGCLL